jgi:hypothetical protein
MDALGFIIVSDNAMEDESGASRHKIFPRKFRTQAAAEKFLEQLRREPATWVGAWVSETSDPLESFPLVCDFTLENVVEAGATEDVIVALRQRAIRRAALMWSEE